MIVTIIKTSIKGLESIQVSDTVEEVHDKLKAKGSFIKVVKISTLGDRKMIIRKGTVKVALEYNKN